MSQERQSQVPLVPLIHGPAEDAIEAQSAAAGPDGREAGSKATELAWLFALTTRKGKKNDLGSQPNEASASNGDARASS